MKRYLLIATVIIASVVIYASCAKKAPYAIKGCTDKTACNYYSIATVDDGTCVYLPTGTASTTINTGSLSNGNMIDFHTGANTCACGNFTVVNGNTGVLFFDPFNFTCCTKSNTTYSSIYTSFGIMDMGAVACLGVVTTKPATRYLVTASATLGHGYVIAVRDTVAGHDTTTYARMYCDSWITNTSGGVVGVKIVWQYPY